MNSWRGFEEILVRGASLAPRTSWRIGGPAELLARPRSIEELAALLARAREERLPARLLGRGTNLLAADAGVRGLVIELRGPAFVGAAVEDERVRAGAGTRLATVIAAACDEGLEGLEPLAGIPGSVGGALRMNAGAAGCAIGEVVEAIEVLEEGGEVRTMSAAEAGFRYRGSGLAGRVVLGATLRLALDSPEAAKARWRDALAARRAAQPLDEPSAGCVFRNPEPGVSAGRLIEEAGLKGRAIGGARVSAKHANFIVNAGDATSADVLALIGLVREVVQRAHGVTLDLEIEVWE